jgi:formylmethanofuran dehydrogenase subunit D
MAKSKDVTIVTYRDIFQEEEEAKNRYSQEYQDLSALILLDKSDLKLLGAEDGQTVQVENEWGAVVVKAVLSQEEEPHSGLAFMPNSPWSNQLISGEVGESKIPDFKNIKAKVSVSDGQVTSLSDLSERMKA